MCIYTVHMHISKSNNTQQGGKDMLYQSDYMEEKAILQTAARMCAAARTAPKAHGRDTLHTLVLTGEEKENLAKKMEEVGRREMGDGMNTWYGRDAGNVRAARRFNRNRQKEARRPSLWLLRFRRLRRL